MKKFGWIFLHPDIKEIIRLLCVTVKSIAWNELKFLLSFLLKCCNSWSIFFMAPRCRRVYTFRDILGGTLKLVSNLYVDAHTNVRSCTQIPTHCKKGPIREQNLGEGFLDKICKFMNRLFSIYKLNQVPTEGKNSLSYHFNRQRIHLLLLL